MTDFDPKMIEALGTAMGVALETPWADIPDDEKPEARRVIAAALSALPLSPEALNAIWRSEAVVVPKVPIFEQAQAGGKADYANAVLSPVCTRADNAADIYRAMLAASPYAKKE